MRNLLLSFKGLGILTLFAVMFSTPLYATHITGVDMSYECIGNNQYVVTVNVYRDCDPFASTFTSANINATSASCGISSGLSWSLPAVDTFEVSQLCPGEISNSTCNGGTLQGREVRIYRDTITLPQTCDDWIISWSNCCRNNSITNISAPGSQNIYAEAFINSNYCSSSPIFSSLPNPYFCAGQLYNFNHGAFDPDGDTLRYEMITPLTSATASVAFTAGHSQTSPLRVDPLNPPTQPLPVFLFNDLTGQMTFRPESNLAQIGVTAVKVYEIRNGDTIGYVMRDIQMVVLDDPNCTTPIDNGDPLPIMGGSYDSTAQTFVVCSGEVLRFTIDLIDPDGDTIFIDFANTNLLQVFGPGNFDVNFVKYGQTSSIPPTSPDSVTMIIDVFAVPANLGNNYFTIGVTDNSCPIPGSQILGYNVIIPGVEVEASDTTICPGIDHLIQLDARSFTTTGTAIQGGYSWSIVSGPAGAVISDDTIKSPTVFIPASATAGNTIVLEVTYTTQPDPNSGTQCTSTDQVNIFLNVFPIDVDLLATDTSLCPNNLLDQSTFSTDVSATSGSIDLVSGTYSWSANPASALTGLSNTNTPNPSTSIAGSYGDEVVYTVRYDYGQCFGEDSIKLTFDYAQMSVAVDSANICPGDTIQLTALWNGGGPASIGGCGINPATCASTTLNTVGAGTLNSTTSSPYFGFYEDRRVQYLFLASELTAAGIQPGIITELSFDVATANGQSYNDFRIKMGCTSLTDLGAQVDFVPGLLQVFAAPGAIAATVGLNTHVFDNSYEWDGTSNLLVEVCFNNTAWASSDPVVYTTSPFQSVLFGYDDGVPTTCPSASNFFIFGTSADRPNIQFGSCGAPDTKYQWSPAIGFLASGGDTTDMPQAAPQAATTYVATLTEGGCTLWDSVSVQMITDIIPPTITCGTPSNQATSVLFEWSGSPGALSWEVSLDSGATWLPQPLANTSRLVTGIDNGDCFSILVRPIGGASPCGPNAGTLFTCCTTPCPLPSQYLDTVNVSCNGGADGMLTLFVDGANGALGAHPPYSVTLYDLAGTQIQTPVSTPDNAMFNNLPIGTYYMTISDTLGCDGYSDSVELIEPTMLVGTEVGTTLTACYNTTDGTATVTAIGGTPAVSGYTYIWDAVALAQTTTTANNLAQGVYSVVVSDSLGCTDTVTNIIVTAPYVQAPLVALDMTNSSNCSGNGTALITQVQNMQGGSVPNSADPTTLTYAWSNGLVDVLSASGLAPGGYSVVVTDTMGCTDTVDFTIGGGAVTNITGFLVANPTCGQADGAATVSASGAASYTYLWGDGQLTASASGLVAGTHYVTVTGSNGCEAMDSVTLVVPGAPVITGFMTSNLSCIGGTGTATVQATGGTLPYTYLWSEGSTLQTATGLNSGTYTVTLTDFNNCVVVGDTILYSPSITVDSIIVTHPSCGQVNGQLSVANSGYLYLWSDGQTTQTATGLSSGTYTVTMTSGTLCEDIASASVNTAGLSISVVDREERVCKGASTGFIDISTTSNGGTVTYAWTGPNGFTETTEDINNLGPGVYSVTATLQSATHTCTGTLSLEIFEAADLVAAIEEVSPLDCSNNNAVLVARGTGGIPNYTYLWEDNSTISDRGPLSPGVYTVILTDSEGCIDSASYTINPLILPTLDAWIENVGQSSAKMLQDGTPLAIDAGANQQGVSYQWIPTTGITDPQVPSTTVSGPSGGSFEYRVVASSGNCSTSDTVFLIVDPVSFLGMPSAFTPNGDLTNDFFRPVQANNIEVRTFQVFNRWGQMLYNNPSDYANGWNGEVNGQIQPRDVYIYVFEYKKPGDTEFTIMRGEVTLLR